MIILFMVSSMHLNVMGQNKKKKTPVFGKLLDILLHLCVYPRITFVMWIINNKWSWCYVMLCCRSVHVQGKAFRLRLTSAAVAFRKDHWTVSTVPWAFRVTVTSLATTYKLYIFYTNSSGMSIHWHCPRSFHQKYFCLLLLILTQ